MSNETETISEVVLDNEEEKKIEAEVSTLKLTQDEKVKLEEAKKKPGRPPGKPKQEAKKVVVNSDFGKVEFSEKEIKECDDIQKALDTFVLEKGDMACSDGIIDTLPTGIDLLDAILGGGFGVGTLTMIVGNPGSFKTTIVGQTFGTSQKKYVGKFLGSYMDSENAMSTARLSQLGVNHPQLKPYNEVTIEKVFKMIECHSAFKEINQNMLDIPSAIAWDSVANTPSQKEMESDSMDINQFIGLRARIISILLPRYISKIKKYGISLLAINQLRDRIDMGMFKTANDIRWIGDKNMPGGNALKFNAFHLVLLTIKGDLNPIQYGFNGVLLNLKCIKNKLFTPNIIIPLLVDFNTGVSNFWTNYNFLVQTKRLNSSAWCSLVSHPQIKFHTKDAPGLYESNPEFKKAFDEQAKEAIQIDIIDKYSKNKTDDSLKDLSGEDQENVTTTEQINNSDINL